MESYVAGIDVGGTKMLAVALTEQNVVRSEHLAPRPVGPEATVEQLVELLAAMAQELDARIDALGVGIAGAITRAGAVQFSPNIPELVAFPLRDLLRGRLDIPVVVDNDATAATWAEHGSGAGRGVDDLLYVALGTGIGTGFVLDGSLYRGAHGFAGESGHIVVDRHGVTHISGVRGPWEMYASGNGLGALARSRAMAGSFPAGVELAGDAAEVRGEHVTRAVHEGDADALELLDEFASHVAVGLTNLVYVLDPAAIVLGGGLVDIGDPLRASVQHAVDTTLLGGAYRPQVEVRLAELGARSAAIGAAMLARDER